MKFEDLTDQQLEFIHGHLVPDFAAQVRVSRQNAFDARKKVATDIIAGFPPAEPMVAQFNQQIGAAELQVGTAFEAAMVAIEQVVTDVTQFRQTLALNKLALTNGLAPLTAPDTASDSEKNEVSALRQKVLDLMPGGAAPTIAGHAAGMKLIAELTRKLAVIRSVRVGENDRKSIEKLILDAPKTAKVLMQKIAWFDTRLGTGPVDGEAISAQAKIMATAKTNVNTAKTELKRLEGLPLSDFASETEQTEKLQEARNALAEAERLAKEATTKHGYMTEKKRLLDATLHGPLAPDTPPPLSDQRSADLVQFAFLNKNAGVAAVNALATSRDPDDTLAVIDKVMEKMKAKFKHGGKDFPFSSDWYGARLIEVAMAAPPDEDLVDLIESYIDDGLHLERDPFGPDPGKDKRAAQRTKKLAEALLDPSGNVVVGEAAMEVALHMLLSPDAVDNGTPMLAFHSLDALRDLADQDIADKLAAVGDPENDDAKALVRKTLGLDEDAPVTANEARLAALTAFLTPIDQGKVGSCFTTAPARRFREEEPDMALEQFVNMVTTGKFTDPDGNEVPVVTKLNENDGNPLVRSFEYSAAALAASQDGSREQKALRTMMFQPEGLKKVKDIVGDTDWTAVRALLVTNISGAFRITYDPTIETAKSNDGSSSRGRFVLVTKAPYAGEVDKPITTKDAYMACLHKIAVHSLTDAGYDPDDDGDKPVFQKVKELIDSDAFANCVGGGKTKPWEMASGGLEKGPTKAMFGGDPTTTDMLGKGAKPPDTATPEEKALADGVRTKAILDKLAKSVEGDPGEQVNIGTAGIHAFSALPQDETLQSVMDPDPTERSKKIDDVLVLPGRKIAATDLTAERATHFYDTQVDYYLSRASDTLLPALKNKVAANRPTGPMTPKAVQAAIDAAVDDYLTALAVQSAEDWKAEQLKKGKTPSDTDYNDTRDKAKKSSKGRLDARAANQMLKTLGLPQVRIADTNWGDASSHTFFVVAPDPRSGELRLWKQTDPGGDMTPMGDDWLYTSWDKTE
jgi:hypothetical protein